MKYDVTIRSLISRGAPALIRLVSGAGLAEALPTEFPAVKDRRADTLVRLDDGRILHIEWQTGFCAEMPRRMLGYWLQITERYPESPLEQAVIQVGGAAKIADRLVDGRLSFGYRVIDSRTLDPAPLLDSPSLEDNILAILFGADDLSATTRAILSRMTALPRLRWRDALTRLMILGGLRAATATILEEASRSMPLHIDFEQDPYLANLIRKGRMQGLMEGRHEGRDEGRHEGRLEGESAALLRLAERRFGPLPAPLLQRVRGAGLAEIERWLDRVIDAESLEAVFADPPAN